VSIVLDASGDILCRIAGPSLARALRRGEVVATGNPGFYRLTHARPLRKLTPAQRRRLFLAGQR
jgi:hypothetical protein